MPVEDKQIKERNTVVTLDATRTNTFLKTRSQIEQPPLGIV
ncbi:hypothetical protein CAter282_2420 [Collimonas arenae]|uniref:Uncharacterized protein n=1 Tax=Collimonas arenae TaxID=279058 RepID=A0A127QJJ4_9BURK|nr:hypothetical protein CAter282_2420 [Collimonas arenae]